MDYYDKLTLRRLDRFQTAVSHLRFEGRHERGKNLAAIRSAVAFFEKEVTPHMKEEETTLFPFLRRHIPRLEPVLCLLLSEHEDFRQSLAELKRLLSKLNRGGSPFGAIDQIREKGTRLAVLMRSHLWAEQEMVHKTAGKELRPEEKRALRALLNNRGGIHGRRFERS